MALKLKKYNPGFLSDDELIQSFCVRTNEFDSIVETLHENTGNSNQHVLVIGPRGSGKTTLLLRVVIEIRRDATMSSRIFPIVFAEESYEVSTCGEFWLECLDRLAAQVSDKEEQEDIRRTWEELQSVRDDQALEERCLGALLDFADREGKRLLLVVENMNMIFRDAADENTGWRLRKTLQTEPRIMLLASATSRFEEIDNPEQALYDLFRILTLRPLSSSECATLWETVSGQDPVMEKIRSLEILTGRNPRLLAIIAGFGGALSFRALMQDLFQMIDEHTEYFRSHIEALSAAQERRVYLALAKLWKPATTREIANLARLDTSQCSALLQRLIERGVVEEKGGTPRRKRYYLTERLYNIYYLLRNGESRKVVQALIQFMMAFYSNDELEEIEHKIVKEIEESSIRNKGFINDFYRQFFELRNKYRDYYSNKEEQRIFELIEEAIKMSKNKNYEAIIDICNNIEYIYDNIINDTNTINMLDINKAVARALLNKSISLTYLDRDSESIIVCNNILERFSENNTPDLIEIIKQVMIHKANTLGKLNRISEEIDIYDHYLDKFDNNTYQMTSNILQIYINKAVALSYLNKTKEAMDIYDNIIEKFDDSKDIQIIIIVAHAFANKGAILGILDKTEESISLNDEIIHRFDNIDIPEIRQFVVQAFMNKGIALIQLNQVNDALNLYEEVVERFSDSDIPVIIGCVGQALIQKSLIFKQENKIQKSLDVCNEVLTQFGENDSLVMSLNIAQALLHKVNLLSMMDNFSEALLLCNDIIDRFVHNTILQIIEIVRMAATNKGLILWQLIQPSVNIQNRSLAWRYLDNQDTCKRDVQMVLGFLAETDNVSTAAIRALLAFSVSLGYESLLALIEEYSLDHVLSPLVTAFRQEIGLETEVSEEVFEIARDIRNKLAGIVK